MMKVTTPPPLAPGTCGFRYYYGRLVRARDDIHGVRGDTDSVAHTYEDATDNTDTSDRLCQKGRKLRRSITHLINNCRRLVVR